MKPNAVLASLGASLAVVNAGKMTSYVNDGNVGACQKPLLANTNYIAVNSTILPFACGSNVTITFNGVTAKGVILDSCSTCVSHTLWIF
jgi:hypothetical protein